MKKNLIMLLSFLLIINFGYKKETVSDDSKKIEIINEGDIKICSPQVVSDFYKIECMDSQEESDYGYQECKFEFDERTGTLGRICEFVYPEESNEDETPVEYFRRCREQIIKFKEEHPGLHCLLGKNATSLVGIIRESLFNNMLLIMEEFIDQSKYLEIEN